MHTDHALWRTVLTMRGEIGALFRLLLARLGPQPRRARLDGCMWWWKIRARCGKNTCWPWRQRWASATR